jgi:hypothetical protein
MDAIKFFARAADDGSIAAEARMLKWSPMPFSR